MTEQWWWGYLHSNGHIQVKRYFEATARLDFQDADESPFCMERTGKFLASGREDALEKAAQILGVKHD